MAKPGRPKGAKNKRSVLVEQIAARFDIDPFEVLMMIAAGDWKGLGYKTKTREFIIQGIPIEEDTIPLAERARAAKEAAKYLYAQKQSVQHSSAPEGIKIVIEDYSSK